MLRSWPVGIVITTGDQVGGVVSDAGLSALQVAFGAEPLTAPQKYPHMGTTDPSGRVTEVEAAVRLTVCWANETLTPRRRTDIARTAVFKVLR
jgi:hypothetical protein